MDIWYKCNNCGKRYPIKRMTPSEAPLTLPDVCQWCKKGTYVKEA